MSIDETKLAQGIKKAAAAVHANEKFVVPVLAVKASRAAQENPHDASLVTASNVLKKMASDNRMFITREELNKLYEKLYSPNTKLAEIFATELDRPQMQGPTVFQRSEFESQSLSSDYQKIGDPVLLNALDAAFGETKESRIYSSETAVNAEKSCKAELSAQGFPPKKISIFAGQEDIIVCLASYDTPKGESSVLVPVEIRDGLALLPNIFLSQAGFMELDRESLEEHIKATGGKSYKVDGQKLLEVLSVAKNGAIDVVGPVELAAIQVRANKAAPHTVNGILYQQVDAAVDPIKDPEMPKTAEHDAFAKRLASPSGVAKHVFGDRIVEAGANMLRRKMASFGFRHSQVGVSAVQDNTILYSVAVDHSIGFKVPVKVQEGMVLPPTMVVAAGNLSDFSREGIVEIMRSGQVDSRSIAEASPSYGLKPSELMAQVREAIAEGNLLKAEDAIDVLGEVDPEAQKRAMGLLLDSFNPDTLKKVASEHKGCNMVVESSVSKYPLCGHLNMPLHKVYQDGNGDCQPLYRRGVEETNEGGIFVTHRLLHY